MVESRDVETVVRRVVPEESSDLQGEVAGQHENRHALQQVQHRRDDMQPPELLHVDGMSCRGRRSVPTPTAQENQPTTSTMMWVDRKLERSILPVELSPTTTELGTVCPLT